MQSKLINLLEITDNDLSCEIKDQTWKTLQRQFFCHRKSHIVLHLRRHLRQHYRLLLLIPIAVKTIKIFWFLGLRPWTPPTYCIWTLPGPHSFRCTWAALVTCCYVLEIATKNSFLNKSLRFKKVRLRRNIYEMNNETWSHKSSQ